MERPGLHKEEEAAAARKGKENMNKSKERMREETKNMNRDERREGDEGAAQKETTDNRQGKKENDGRHGATDWNIRGQEEAAQQRGPLDWNIRGDAEASGQAHGARTGTSGEERTGRQQGHPDRNIRGAEARDWDNRGRSEWPWKGASRASAQRGGGGGGTKSGRPDKENMNKSNERMGEETKIMNRDERREGDEGAAQKETTSKARRRRKVGMVPRTGTSGARKKPHSNGAPWTGTSGGTQRQADKRTEPGLEHPGKNVPAGNRATRTGTSGGQKPGTGTTGEEASGPGKERPGLLHNEEEAAVARKAGGQTRRT